MEQRKVKRLAAKQVNNNAQIILESNMHFTITTAHRTAIRSKTVFDFTQKHLEVFKVLSLLKVVNLKCLTLRGIPPLLPSLIPQKPSLSILAHKM